MRKKRVLARLIPDCVRVGPGRQGVHYFTRPKISTANLEKSRVVKWVFALLDAYHVTTLYLLGPFWCTQLGTLI